VTEALPTSTPAPAARPRTPRQLMRSSAVVAAGTSLSRITGLLRVFVLVYAVGQATTADTYNIANTTPNIVYELLLGGVLSATLVPLFVEHVQRDDERGTQAIFTVTMTALIIFTGLAMLFAPAIAHLYTFRKGPQYRGAEQRVATELIWLFMPQMLFYGFTALASAALNARNRFAAAAFAPVLNNVVVIVVLLVFTRTAGSPLSQWESVTAIEHHHGLILLLGIGTTAGIVAMAIALVPPMLAAHMHFRPVFEWRNPAVTRLLRLSGWTIGYVAANQLALGFVYVLANGSARSGLVAAYTYAYAFFQLPHGLIAVSLMTTITPELARAANARDFAGLRTQLDTGLRYLLVTMIPAGVLFVVLAQPIAGVLVRGNFGPTDAHLTGDTLQAMAIGLVPFSVYLYVLRGFYAMQDTRSPFIVNCAENALNVLLALLLFGRLSVQGLGLAWSGAYIAAALIALVWIARRTGGGFSGRTGSVAVRPALAGLATAAVAAPVAGAIGSADASHALAAASIAAIAGGAVYLLVLRLLGVTEVQSMVATFRLRRSPVGPDV
jgi:putative peptidoglycan lipid II flippase